MDEGFEQKQQQHSPPRPAASTTPPLPQQQQKRSQDSPPPPAKRFRPWDPLSVYRSPSYTSRNLGLQQPPQPSNPPPPSASSKQQQNYRQYGRELPQNSVQSGPAPSGPGSPHSPPNNQPLTTASNQSRRSSGSSSAPATATPTSATSQAPAPTTAPKYSSYPEPYPPQSVSSSPANTSPTNNNGPATSSNRPGSASGRKELVEHDTSSSTPPPAAPAPAASEREREREPNEREKIEKDDHQTESSGRRRRNDPAATGHQPPNFQPLRTPRYIPGGYDMPSGPPPQAPHETPSSRRYPQHYDSYYPQGQPPQHSAPPTSSASSSSSPTPAAHHNSHHSHMHHHHHMHHHQQPHHHPSHSPPPQQQPPYTSAPPHRPSTTAHEMHPQQPPSTNNSTIQISSRARAHSPQSPNSHIGKPPSPSGPTSYGAPPGPPPVQNIDVDQQPPPPPSPPSPPQPPFTEQTLHQQAPHPNEQHHSHPPQHQQQPHHPDITHSQSRPIAEPTSSSTPTASATAPTNAGGKVSRNNSSNNISSKRDLGPIYTLEELKQIRDTPRFLDIKNEAVHNYIRDKKKPNDDDHVKTIVYDPFVEPHMLLDQVTTSSSSSVGTLIKYIVDVGWLKGLRWNIKENSSVEKSVTSSNEPKKTSQDLVDIDKNRDIANGTQNDISTADGKNDKGTLDNKKRSEKTNSVVNKEPSNENTIINNEPSSSAKETSAEKIDDKKEALGNSLQDENEMDVDKPKELSKSVENMPTEENKEVDAIEKNKDDDINGNVDVEKPQEAEEGDDEDSEEWTMWDLKPFVKRQLWGTDVYTDDSDILAILIHSGWIKLDGLRQPTSQDHDDNGRERTRKNHRNQDLDVLEVSVRIAPKLVRYYSTLRAGLKSRGWGNSHDGVSLYVEGVKIISMKTSLSPIKSKKTRKTNASMPSPSPSVSLSRQDAMKQIKNTFKQELDSRRSAAWKGATVKMPSTTAFLLTNSNQEELCNDEDEEGSAENKSPKSDTFMFSPIDMDVCVPFDHVFIKSIIEDCDNDDGTERRLRSVGSRVSLHTHALFLEDLYGKSRYKLQLIKSDNKTNDEQNESSKEKKLQLLLKTISGAGTGYERIISKDDGEWNENGWLPSPSSKDDTTVSLGPRVEAKRMGWMAL